MQIIKRMAFSDLAVTIVLVLFAAPAASDDQWRKLPSLPGRADHISAIALEGDTLWATAGTAVAYWDGGAWQIPDGPKLLGGIYLSQFMGGGERPLYLTQPGETEGRGRIFRLSDGAAKAEADFEYEAAHMSPGIMATRAGFIRLAKGQLSSCAKRVWTKVAAPEEFPLVIETADATCCYFPRAQKLLRIDLAGKIREERVALAFSKNGTGIRGRRWGEDRVLLLEQFRPNLTGFRLATGEALDLGELNGKIDESALWDCISTRDGSVWLLVTNAKTEKREVIRVRASGECETLADIPRTRWDQNSFSQHARAVLETKTGDLWLGGGLELLRIREGSGSLFGQETGLALHATTHLLEDSRGNLFAANSGGVYARFAEEPPAALPAPRKPDPSAPPVWTFPREKLPPLKAAWKVGPNLYAITGHLTVIQKPEQRELCWLVAVAADTGERRFQRELVSDVFATPWLLEQSDEKILQIALPKRLGRFDAQTGKTLAALDLACDSRIAPLPVEGGHVVIPTSRGSEAALVDQEGRTKWSCTLPGYVMLHPASFGQLALFQTRGGSYGGQETACVNLEKGTLLWTDVTDAYGCGAAFFNDEAFVVEADQFFSPQRSEGWLIGRNPQTGERLWHYRQAGGIHHPPLVDRRTARVYGVFSRGEVVCLRGEDGSVVWQQTLPEGASAAGAADSYHPAWSPHTLAGGRLAVVDRNLVLHLLDAKTGEFQASIALHFDDPPMGIPAPQLVGPPWISDDAVIAAFSTGLVSIPIAKKAQP
ncbi:MAG TPA: PQQ-binding-like beta-propeller repeat protein [Pirellulaceae bacterium]|nr:PQQ-binding-like beta-propeller repeat protein [Pirellulaceae bacterium]